MAIPVIGDIVKSVLGKDGIAGKVLDKFVADKDLKAKLLHELDMATQDDNQEYRVLLTQAETAQFEAQQKTIQAELHQSDLYTKQTRPKIARRSFNFGLVYIVLTAIPDGGLNLHWITIMPWTFSMELAVLLFSPSLTYMGVRGLEKWKKGGDT